MNNDRMTFQTAVQNLLVNFGELGMDRKTAVRSVREGIENYGFSVRASYLIVKMSLCETFDMHDELFYVDDVCAITGETKAEVINRIELQRTHLEEMGEDPNRYFFKEQKSYKFMYNPKP